MTTFASVTLEPADGGGAQWASAIGAAVMRAMGDPGNRGHAAIAGRVSVDRPVEPNQVGIERSVNRQGLTTPRGTITLSVADKAVALDQIASIFRTALTRSATSDAPRCC